MIGAPDYRLSINGADITPAIEGRLVSLAINDRKGFEADDCSIVIDDHDGLVALPRRGVELEIWLGYKGEPLINKGVFIVDEVGHQGPPDQITIRGRSADFRADLLAQKTRAWDNVTLGDVVQTIAGKHKLEPGIADNLAGAVIKHIDQTDESDANFLTRLGVRYGAIATVKNKTLLFMRAGDGKTKTGQDLPTIIINRSDGDAYNFVDPDRESAFSGVTARWLNYGTGQVNHTTAGEAGKVKVIKKTFATQDEAKAAAEAEWKALARGSKRCKITTARAMLDIIPESPIKMVGFKSEVDAVAWIVSDVSHNLSGALTSSLSLELINS
ncbi:MAG: contractile injection system protein, VgrG/Pvc8 family [Gammaproteobacteria bacterium]|nr:contractile injection system protein, VgrG/Pvc8 family [Gammaproteobacteria bacterium]